MKYYSIKEVAKMLRCDPETIRRKIRSGKLKAIKYGMIFKVEENDIIELLKKETTGVDFENKNLNDILSQIFGI